MSSVCEEMLYAFHQHQHVIVTIRSVLPSLKPAAAQVDVIDRERSLLMTMMQEQLDTSRSSTSNVAPPPLANSHAQHRAQRLQHHANKSGSLKILGKPLVSTQHCASSHIQHAGVGGQTMQPSSNHDVRQHAASENVQHCHTSIAADTSPDISSRVREIADSLESTVPQCSSAETAMAHLSSDSQFIPHRILNHSSQDAITSPDGTNDSEQPSFWEDKQKLVPNLSGCIEEVKLLRASLSNTSVLAQD